FGGMLIFSLFMGDYFACLRSESSHNFIPQPVLVLDGNGRLPRQRTLAWAAAAGSLSSGNL
ncbi:MAG: hypothetical protein KDE34_24320, partial [Anaerolineales bacterium]|nr:hypothetical protein [Anaerolineales bacterium]